MCEVLDRVEARGREKGREEGRAEGMDLTRMESIKNVMSTLKLTAQQAMDALLIPAAEQPKYLNRLGN